MWAGRWTCGPSFSTLASLRQVGLSWARLRTAGCEQLASAVCSKLPFRSHNEKCPQDYGTSPGARSPRAKKSPPGARARCKGQAAPCNSPAPHRPTWRPSHSRPRSEPCLVWRQGGKSQGLPGLHWGRTWVGAGFGRRSDFSSRPRPAVLLWEWRERDQLPTLSEGDKQVTGTFGAALPDTKLPGSAWKDNLEIVI